MTTPVPTSQPVLVLAPDRADAARALHGATPGSWRYVCVPSDVVDMVAGQPYLIVDPGAVVLNTMRSKVLATLRLRGREVTLLDVPS